MAFPMAETVKLVKAIGTYDDCEIAEAMSQIDKGDMKMIHNLSQQLLNQLENVHARAVSGKKTKCKQSPKMSQQEKVECVIRKIELALGIYERTDSIDSWELSFPVGVYYGNKTFEEIRVIHNKLINAGSGVDKLRLLNFAERGRLYDFLKNSDDRYGSWRFVCQELDVCRRTVDRYIDFFNIINAYPRLIICELSFEAIMAVYKQLQQHLNAHDSLSDRLKIPLKQTRLCGGGIFSSRKMPGGDDDIADAPSQLRSEGASWDPAWQLADEYFASESD